MQINQKIKLLKLQNPIVSQKVKLIQSLTAKQKAVKLKVKTALVLILAAIVKKITIQVLKKKLQVNRKNNEINKNYFFNLFSFYIARIC